MNQASRHLPLAFVLAGFFLAGCAASGDRPSANPASAVAGQPRTQAGPTPSRFRALLTEHNRLRASHCAAGLSWSGELARTAQRWADKLAARGCAFEHSGSPFGENLAAGTSGTLGAEKTVAMWYDEVSDYNFEHGSFSMEAGHFTQLVWRATQHLGCGTSTCKGLVIWVCNYDSPGNVEGQFQQNVLPTTCK